MSTANIGGNDLPRVTISREAEMAAYDALPPAIRSELAAMAVQWNAAGAAALIEKHGVPVTLNTLRHVEGDMQASYRRRIAA